MLSVIGFVDPAIIGALGCGDISQRSRVSATRFSSAHPDKIFLILYNSGNHWMLTIVNVDNETIYFMDPLNRIIIDKEWKQVVHTGIAQPKPSPLGCCKPLNNHENSPFFSCCKHSSSHQFFFSYQGSSHSAAASSTAVIDQFFFSHQALPLAAGAAQQLLALAAASIPAAINSLL
ncbi:Hypothetical predicted protein [Prunus dulcis]|uniref:Ubiquitin-like protease family profile domain-containing protein n=2 Tax=Prunus dulcis TaxID=3755 RepID=A0A5E4G9T5_PRUDU|nr:Hypothetical predicted protein [Prunus dulcis]